MQLNQTKYKAKNIFFYITLLTGVFLYNSIYALQCVTKWNSNSEYLLVGYSNINK